jgi:hypothetical protein
VCGYNEWLITHFGASRGWSRFTPYLISHASFLLGCTCCVDIRQIGHVAWSWLVNSLYTSWYGVSPTFFYETNFVIMWCELFFVMLCELLASIYHVSVTWAWLTISLCIERIHLYWFNVFTCNWIWNVLWFVKIQQSVEPQMPKVVPCSSFYVLSLIRRWTCITQATYWYRPSNLWLVSESLHCGTSAVICILLRNSYPYDIFYVNDTTCSELKLEMVAALPRMTSVWTIFCTYVCSWCEL